MSDNISPSPSFLEKIFGTEKERFTKGIKKRRLEREAGLPEDYDKQLFENMPTIGMTKYLKASGVPDKTPGVPCLEGRGFEETHALYPRSRSPLEAKA